MAGLEYSKECWCGSSYDNDKKVPEPHCAMTCPGDHSQRCGGNFLINVYDTQLLGERQHVLLVL